MSLIASARDGYAQAGWRLIAGVSLAFCLAPAFAGAIAFGAVRLAGPDRLGEGYIWLAALFTLATLSPLVSWPFWAVTGLCTALLMRQGRCGALPAAAVGALAGGLTGALTGQPLMAPLGAILATFHRFTLALLRPLAF